MSALRNRMWLKRVWIPFWVVQIILSAIAIFIACIGLIKEEYLWDAGYTTLAMALEGGGAAIWMAWGSVSLLLDIIEIILFACGKLNPKFALISTLLKSKMWLILLIIAIYKTTVGINGAGVTIAIMVIFYLAFLGTFIYSIVIFRRYLKSTYDLGTYKSPNPVANEIPEIEISDYNHAIPKPDSSVHVSTRPGDAYETLRSGVSETKTDTVHPAYKDDTATTPAETEYKAEATEPRSYVAYRAPPFERVTEPISPSIYSVPDRL